ncbi:probable calcium-binding protein CML48 isoform X2 [Ziziphus jujuba]|uniref:EF-hand domain-containing protein n=2 Tax=Ziziphus jujuba TaxID=326968 RepID=A0A978VSG2_ZIZJJ|nr:probable calcium-binding protein CML48 isoform X2 [Ziziphus jujuba]KAH7541757.1 hypothetical protein FEM48_Zijuj02G0001600 [Ziziphus jujuba var. spinosa]
MASFGRYGSHSHTPSAPSLPEDQNNNNNNTIKIPSFLPPQPHAQQQQQQQQQQTHASYSHHVHANAYSQPAGGYSSDFPPETHPDVIRSFQMVDRDGSGYIDENELQHALSSSGYQRFSLGTIRLLIFLFTNPSHPGPLRIGLREFSALWSCLGHWRAIFEKFDGDRSGKINVMELRDALYSIGYAIPPPVLQLLISKYGNESGQRGELNFDSFVECAMIVKGLTEKFKEKDPGYTGAATFSYDAFMSMVIPFIASYN